MGINRGRRSIDMCHKEEVSAHEGARRLRRYLFRLHDVCDPTGRDLLWSAAFGPHRTIAKREQCPNFVVRHVK